MEFVAFERSLQGTGASRRLRKAGKVPGIVYGAGEPKPIELDHNALFHALKKEAFHASILDMELGGKKEKVLLRDYQMHPFKALVLHVGLPACRPQDQDRQEGAAALQERGKLPGRQARQVPGEPRASMSSRSNAWLRPCPSSSTSTWESW